MACRKLRTKFVLAHSRQDARYLTRMKLLQMDETFYYHISRRFLDATEHQQILHLVGNSLAYKHVRLICCEAINCYPSFKGMINRLLLLAV